MNEIFKIDSIEGLKAITGLTPEELAQLPKHYNEIQKENEHLKNQLDLVKLVLDRTNFKRIKVTSEDVRNCEARFIIERKDNGDIDFYKQMVPSDLDGE